MAYHGVHRDPVRTNIIIERALKTYGHQSARKMKLRGGFSEYLARLILKDAGLILKDQGLQVADAADAVKRLTARNGQ